MGIHVEDASYQPTLLADSECPARLGLLARPAGPGMGETRALRPGSVAAGPAHRRATSTS